MIYTNTYIISAVRIRFLTSAHPIRKLDGTRAIFVDDLH